MSGKAHTALTAPLVLRHTSMAKCGINIFFIVIYNFSLVKATMNAASVCKLRNGVKKTPQFLLFSTAKGGPNAQ
jgi:hypothetical protein